MACLSVHNAKRWGRKVKCPVLTEFTRVKNLNNGKEGYIIDVLSAQFTVDYDDDTFGYLMKSDYKVDWDIIKEEKKEIDNGKDTDRTKEILEERKAALRRESRTVTATGPRNES